MVKMDLLYSSVDSNAILFWRDSHRQHAEIVLSQLPGHPLTQSSWHKKLTITLFLVCTKASYELRYGSAVAQEPQTLASVFFISEVGIIKHILQDCAVMCINKESSKYLELDGKCSVGSSLMIVLVILTLKMFSEDEFCMEEQTRAQLMLAGVVSPIPLVFNKVMIRRGNWAIWELRREQILWIKN